VKKRLPVLRDNKGNWLYDKKNHAAKPIRLNAEMKKMKAAWKRK